MRAISMAMHDVVGLGSARFDNDFFAIVQFYAHVIFNQFYL